MRKIGSLGDIDAVYNALRPRLIALVETVIKNYDGTFGEGSGTVGPHTHSADQITYTPATTGGVNIISEECQASQEELLDEKLARSGAQPMQGHLQMNDGLGPWRIYDILDLYLTGGLGAARVTGARRISMAGDDSNDEARIELLDRVKFNKTATQAVIEDPSRAEWNIGVTPSTHYVPIQGVTSWSSLEGTWVVNVTSGNAIITGTISSTAALYAPSSVKALTGGTVASSSALYAPTIEVVAVSVTTGTVASSSSVGAPGIETVFAGTVASSSALYAPTVSQP